MNEVKKYYASGIAKVYDFLDKLWNPLVASRANKQMVSLLKPNQKILDAGCGTGRNLERILKSRVVFKGYTGVDFSPQMLSQARKKFSDKRVVFLEKDVFEVEGSYDLIICTWMLSHTKDQVKIVNFLRSKLNKKGKLFLLFYTKPHWIVGFWLNPIARTFWKANYVTEEEISQFKGVEKKKNYFVGICTCVVITSKS